jgi:arsenite methyltransferase
MKRRILLICMVLVGFVFLASSEPMHAGEHDWSDAEHWSAVFDDPDRAYWQKPLTLAMFLGISRGETIADIGAGTGYFTRYLVSDVSPTGAVYAVDIEQAMLDHLMAREDIQTKLVIPVVAEKDDPKLPEGKIDLIVVMNTWHHIGKRLKYLKKLETSLSPEGRVAIIDFRLGEFPVGPPDSQKLSREKVLKEFEKAGWRMVAETVALPYQYGLIFLPPEKKDTRRFITR